MSKVRKYMRTRYAHMSTVQYIEKKKTRLGALKKAYKSRAINNARDYLVLANAISGKARIDSRRNIIIKGEKETYVSDK